MFRLLGGAATAVSFMRLTECITENKRPKMAPGKLGLVGGGGGWELKSPALDARA